MNSQKSDLPTVKKQQKIPPPLLFLAGVVALKQMPIWGAFQLHWFWTILPLLLSGILALGSLWQFWQARTTISPMTLEKTSFLVTDGVYAWSRNPMYLSLLLALFAYFLWLGNGLGIVVLAAFVWELTHWQIKAEEYMLLTLFGEEYAQYCTRVRRWI